MLIPTLSGASLGAFLTLWINPDILKYVLLSAMIAIALLMLLSPHVIAPPEGTREYTIRERPFGFVMLFGAGLYGGFVQAGVGFVLIAALSAELRYDLVRANALKVVCTAVLSFVSLGVFAAAGRVEWIAGVILALGATVGATLSVKLALNVEQRVIKWLLFVMVCLTCGSALILGGP